MTNMFLGTIHKMLDDLEKNEKVRRFLGGAQQLNSLLLPGKGGYFSWRGQILLVSCTGSLICSYCSWNQQQQRH